jgi:hypothetical protein
LDWSNHKIICKSFDHDRPTDLHRRVLLFPGGNTPPRFEWLEAWPNSALGLPGSGEFLNTPIILGTENSDLNNCVWNTIQGRIVRRKREESLYYFKQSQDDPDFPAPMVTNHGLRAFTRAGACRDSMKGPIIVSRVAEFELMQLTHRDMDMRDARNTADWLSQVGRERGTVHAPNLRDTEVLGTTIESTGRVINQGLPQWSNVLIPGDDVLWTSEGSQIANLLGLPLLFRSSSYGKGTLIPHPGTENPAATLLHRDVISQKVLAASGLKGAQKQLTYYGDHKFEAERERLAFVGITGFGSSMSAYSIVPDTCYVARADGKPLPKEHTEAICSYIADKVEPQLIAATEDLYENDVVPMRNEILDSITKDSFLEYYEAMREEKVKRCHMSWRDLPNPYEIKEFDVGLLKAHAPRVPTFVHPPIPRIGPIENYGWPPNDEPTYRIA